MKILLDENVPARLRRSFPNDQVATVQELGWAGFKNGKLLQLAESQFEVFVLADKKLRYQQNLGGRKLALVELPTNRWPVLQTITTTIVSAVSSVKPGAYEVVHMPANP